MITRRAFIVATTAASAPQRLFAQRSSRLARIGFLSVAEQELSLDPFRDNLRRLGYVEDRDVVLEVRLAQSHPGKLAELALELASLSPDVIVAGGSDAIRAAQRATRTIPIVMTQTSGAVESGFVTDLAHPGGNTTGISTQALLLGQKRVELIRQILPGASSVGILVNPTNPSHPPGVKVIEKAARSLGVEIRTVEVREAGSLERAFRAMIRMRTDAFLALPDNMMFGQRALILELAERHRLPSVYWRREFVEEGGLVSYGADNPRQYRRAAIYVDKILKGARPGDLPVEQVNEFEMLVNLRTAKALGIQVPYAVLVQATRVIE